MEGEGRRVNNAGVIEGALCEVEEVPLEEDVVGEEGV
jgi:hypothetical protein